MVHYRPRPGPRDDPGERRRLLGGILGALTLLAILVGVALIMYRSWSAGVILLAAAVWVLWRLGRHL